MCNVHSLFDTSLLCPINLVTSLTKPRSVQWRSLVGRFLGKTRRLSWRVCSSLRGHHHDPWVILKAAGPRYIGAAVQSAKDQSFDKCCIVTYYFYDCAFGGGLGGFDVRKQPWEAREKGQMRAMLLVLADICTNSRVRGPQPGEEEVARRRRYQHRLEKKQQD